VNYVQDMIKGTNSAIGYLYCDYKNPQTQNAPDLLSSIARQFLEQRSSVLPEVTHFCDKNVAERRRPTGDEWISLIKTLCASFSKKFIFIDALVQFPVHIIMDNLAGS
jgi:hypothetical protein